MSLPPVISLAGLSHRYGDRLALDAVSFDVRAGEIFGLLGPNGGGKTTLFRVLSTLLPVQSGDVRILERNVAADAAAVRARIGVTFQSPSLDGKLTVRENLKAQGQLYGLWGARLRERIELLLARLGLADRAHDRADTLSGGLKRRVEIAKGLLHDPRVLLLDEPSTGLDPGARLDLWRYLDLLRRESGVSVLVTTHLMEEAERCDRLGILDQGRLVALGTPAELRAAIGGDVVTIAGNAAGQGTPESLAERVRTRFNVQPQVVSGQLRLEVQTGAEFLRELLAEFGAEIASVSLAKPTLEDVFVLRTGHRFWDGT